MIEDFHISPEDIPQATKISQIPFFSRTDDEMNLYMKVLANFEFIQKKVSNAHLSEALEAAAEVLKYVRVPAGKFLYHLNHPSDAMYLILSGEAWEFRAKTDFEIDFESNNAGKKEEGSKFLETIRLAKLSKERKQQIEGSVLAGAAPPTQSLQQKPEDTKKDPKKNNNPTSTSEIPPSKNLQEPSTRPVLQKTDKTGFFEEGKGPLRFLQEKTLQTRAENLFEKFKKKKVELNFENEYLYNIVKRNTDLGIMYMKNSILQLKFRKKYGPFDTIGETNIEGSSPDGAIFAYTGLDVLVLDQVGFEKIFISRSGDLRQKLKFFFDYFKDVKYPVLKRVCFLFQEQRFKLNDILYKEDSPCDDLFFIQSGEVQLLKSTTEKLSWIEQEQTKNFSATQPVTSKTKKNISIANILQNHFFGEEILFDLQQRKFTARAVSNGLCYKLSSEVLRMLPENLIKRLRESSRMKLDWRGERIQNLEKNEEVKKPPATLQTLQEINYIPPIESTKPKKVIQIFSRKFSEMSTFNYRAKKKVYVDYAKEIFGESDKTTEKLTTLTTPKNSKRQPMTVDFDKEPLSIPRKKSPHSHFMISSYHMLDAATNTNITPSSLDVEDVSLRRGLYHTLANLNSKGKLNSPQSEEGELISPHTFTQANLKKDLLKDLKNKISGKDKKIWSSISGPLSPASPNSGKSVASKTFGHLIKNINCLTPKDPEVSRLHSPSRMQEFRSSRSKARTNYSTTLKTTDFDSNILDSFTSFPKLEVGPAQAKKFKLVAKRPATFGTPLLKFRSKKA